MSQSDFSELDALLAESMQAKREADEVRAAKERAKRGGLSSKQQAEDAERLRRWEMANEWKGVANVAQFERHRCACGAQRTIFRQLMQRQQHRHLRDSQRWIAVDASDVGLPNEVVVQKWNTPMCTDCSQKAGFEFAPGKVTEWTA